MVYEIEGRKFTLTKRNIRMRNLYAEIADLGTDISRLVEEAQTYTESVQDEPTIEDKSERRERDRKVSLKYQEFDARRRELSDKITQKREDLLVMILKRNGIEYDPEFWLDYADIEDINNIVAGIFKEGAESGK